MKPKLLGDDEHVFDCVVDGAQSIRECPVPLGFFSQDQLWHSVDMKPLDMKYFVANSAIREVPVRWSAQEVLSRVDFD